MGVDIRAPYGTPYYAVADGEVVWVGNRKRSNPSQISALGWHVWIKHRDGYETCYAHAEPAIPVKRGDSVQAGDLIARSGNTGNTSGPHLHLYLKNKAYSLRGFYRGYLNPQPFLDELLNGTPKGFADMSHWNGSGHDWQGYFGRYGRLIVKATEHASHVDGQLAAFSAAAKAHAGDLGFYHFMRGNVDVIDQAEWCWKHVSQHEHNLRLWLDVEKLDIHLDDVMGFSDWWLEAVGYRPIIYTRWSLWKQLKGDRSQFADHDFVFAEYNDKGFTQPDFGRVVVWQRSETAEYPPVYSQVSGRGHDWNNVIVEDALYIPKRPPIQSLHNLLSYVIGRKSYRVRGSDGREQIFSYRPEQDSWQPVLDGNGIFWLIKDRQGEQFRVRDGMLQRGWDTSESDTRMYAQWADKLRSELFADWLPLLAAAGQKSTNAPFVQHYSKPDGKLLNSGTVRSSIVIESIGVPHIVNQGTANHHQFDDCLVLRWESGERYVYARGVGLIYWTGRGVVTQFKEWAEASEQLDIYPVMQGTW